LSAHRGEHLASLGWRGKHSIPHKQPCRYSIITGKQRIQAGMDRLASLHAFGEGEPIHSDKRNQ